MWVLGILQPETHSIVQISDCGKKNKKKVAKTIVIIRIFNSRNGCSIFEDGCIRDGDGHRKLKLV